MNQVNLLTAPEMNAQVASQQADLEQIQTILGEKMTNGPAAAQSKRLVAYGLAKQAAHILEQAAGSVQYLRIKEEPAQAEELKETVKAQASAVGEQLDTIAGDTLGSDTGSKLGEQLGELVSGMIDMVEGVAEQIAAAMGVQEEAIGPFVVECTSIMLASSGDMISQAKAMLEAADAAESAAKQN